MMSSKKSYSTLLIATDLSPLGAVAVACGDFLAQALGSERIHLIHVVDAPQNWAPAQTPAPRRRILPKRVCALLKKRSISLSSPRVEFFREVRVGGAAEQIALAAKKCDADLVVIATHGRGPLGRAVFGSVASTLVRTAPFPVLIVGRDRRSPSPLRRTLPGDGDTINALLPKDFFDLQDELVAKAKKMAEIAGRPAHDSVAIAEAYGEIAATCVKCHTTYMFVQPADDEWESQVESVERELRVESPY